jgi:hypothetical protein
MPEGDQQPAITPQPRVYRTGGTAPPASPPRTPSEPPAPEYEPPRQRQRPLAPAYGDLLSPAAPQASSPAPPVASPGSPPPYQSSPPPYQSSPPPYQSTPPGQVNPEGGPQFAPPQRSGAWPEPQAPPDPQATGETDRSGPRTGVIVTAVLGSAAALVLLTLGVAAGLSWLSQPSADGGYQVGECVVRDGAEAKASGCDADGAYEIVSQVDSRDECPDQTQPTIEISGDSPKFYCLAEVAGGGTGEEPQGGEATPAGGEENSSGDEGSGGQ